MRHPQAQQNWLPHINSLTFVAHMQLLHPTQAMLALSLLLMVML